jgi:hypothetical protein
VSCNGADDDCDPSTEDGPDADADGADLCADCDDADPTRSPGTPEVLCNGNDDDCDPLTPDVIDADGDGWDGCADCDDTEPDIHPWAHDPCDAVDTDCDGDDGCHGPLGNVNPGYSRGVSAVAELALYGERSSDHAGRDVALDDLDGDGRADVVVGSWADDGAGLTSGVVYVFTDLDAWGWRSLADATASLSGTAAYDQAAEIGAPGDLDGDGVRDLLVGSRSRNGGAGTTWLARGRFAGPTSLASAWAVFEGEAAGDSSAGWWTHGVGDLDGDGQADMAIGAPLYDDGAAVDACAAYVFHGPVASGLRSVATADATLVGLALDRLGSAPFGLDWDGDGISEVLVDATGSDLAGADRGCLHIVPGPFAARVEAASAAAASLCGASDGDGAGFPAAPVGDLDGDGLEDLAVGDADAELHLLYQRPLGIFDLAAADARVVDPLGYTLFSVAGAGDLDLDGAADLAIGQGIYSNYYAYSQEGAMFLLRGPFVGVLSLGDAATFVTGESSYAFLGASLDAGLDVDADGVPDVVTGGQNDTNPVDGAYGGAAYVLFGGAF